MLITAVGPDKEETVAQQSIFIHHGHAACNGSIETAGLLLHPTNNLWCLQTSLLGRALSQETSGKGFCQHIKVGTWLPVEQRSDMLEVTLQFIPSDDVLYDCYLQHLFTIFNDCFLIARKYIKKRTIS